MEELIFADRVEETTTTTGTGNLVLAGATTGHRDFGSVLSIGDRFYYLIDGAPADPAQWEVGIGTLNASGEIERAPIASSDANAAVDLAAGTKTVSLTVAAQLFDRVEAGFRSVILEPEAATDNWNRTLIEVPAGTGMVEGGVDNAVNAGLRVAAGRVTNGPTGEPDYWDTVVGFGTNMSSVWTPLNPALGSGSFRVESKFAQGGPTDVFGTELHISGFAKTGEEYRAFTTFIPHEAGNFATVGGSDVRGAVVNLQDGSGAQAIKFDWTTANGGQISVRRRGTACSSILFESNNVTVLRMLSSDGTTYLPLPYYNANNNIQLSNAVYVVGPAGNNPMGVPAALAVNCTSAANETSALAVNGPAVTGNFYAMKMLASATGTVFHQMYNSGSGRVVLDMQAGAGAANDSIVAFSNIGAGGTSWSVGLDNSDGDKLKIEASYRAVGTAANVFVEFDAAAGVSYFRKPPRMPNYTVATLPSAVTAGAGARAFVTDASAPAFGAAVAGGGAVKVPVYSDGAGWRVG
jgi:hypothetical protein